MPRIALQNRDYVKAHNTNGVMRYAPTTPHRLEPFNVQDNHPCAGCSALDHYSGVLYCYLPVCMRKDFFKEGAVENETK